LDDAQFYDLAELLELIKGRGDIAAFKVFSKQFGSDTLTRSEDGLTIKHSAVETQNESTYIGTVPFSLGHVYTLKLQVKNMRSGLFIGITRWTMRTWSYLNGLYVHESGYWADDLQAAIQENIITGDLFPENGELTMIVDRVLGQVTWESNEGGTVRRVRVTKDELKAADFEVIGCVSMFRAGMEVTILEVLID